MGKKKTEKNNTSNTNKTSQAKIKDLTKNERIDAYKEKMNIPEGFKIGEGFRFDDPEAPPTEIRFMDRDKMLKMDIRNWLENTPFSEFLQEIQKRVIGQDELKLVLINVYSYLRAIVYGRKISHNMIISAPSGCGKTETYRALRDYFDDKIPTLPVYICDMSQITTTGFKGADVSTILTEFSRRRMEKAVGLVFLDEFDKKMEPIYDGHGMNVNREAQANLLTLIEGSRISVPSKSNNVVDTSYTMFIGLGSFSAIREKDEKVKNPIGMGNTEEWKKCEERKNHYRSLEREDLIRAGGSMELVGRFPYIFNYKTLSEDGIRKVIEKIKEETMNSMMIDQLELSEDVMKSLVEMANTGFGCRLIDAKLKEIIIESYEAAFFDKPNEELLMEMEVKKKNVVSVKWMELPEMWYEDL